MPRSAAASISATVPGGDGSLFIKAFHLGLLADAHGRLGNVERGLTLIAEGLALVDRTNERWCEAELYRRRGDLLASVLGDGEAETAYGRAIEVARYQGGRALELRAATRLAELLIRLGRPKDVADLLTPIVENFGRESGLADLDRARILLAEAGTVVTAGA